MQVGGNRNIGEAFLLIPDEDGSHLAGSMPQHDSVTPKRLLMKNEITRRDPRVGGNQKRMPAGRTGFEIDDPVQLHVIGYELRDVGCKVGPANRRNVAEPGWARTMTSIEWNVGIAARHMVLDPAGFGPRQPTDFGALDLVGERFQLDEVLVSEPV